MSKQTQQRLADTALRLIVENGRTVTLRKYTETGPSYEPVLTPVDQDVLAVQTKNDMRAVQAGVILTTDTTYLIGGEYDTNDYIDIVDGGKERKIVHTDTIEPSDIPIIYKVTVR